jgi:6,7-dimethyl-8-ribityllumazine synthase
MARVHEGKLLGAGRRFGIVVSRFNELVGNRLLEGALDCLRRHGVEEDGIEVFWTPGSYEIPPVLKAAGARGRFHGLIALGAVIRGDTPHFDYIASEVAKGVAAVALELGVPVIFGVVTADSLDQALERAGGKAGNKGWNAALSALEMADLYAQMGTRKKA